MDEEPHQEAIDVDVPITPTADQIRHAWYDQLVAGATTPPTCLPDHGIHVYPDHRGTGPCQCKTNKPEEGAR